MKLLALILVSMSASVFAAQKADQQCGYCTPCGKVVCKSNQVDSPRDTASVELKKRSTQRPMRKNSGSAKKGSTL